jgi:hypothetical protein
MPWEHLCCCTLLSGAWKRTGTPVCLPTNYSTVRSRLIEQYVSLLATAGQKQARVIASLTGVRWYSRVFQPVVNHSSTRTLP